MRLTRSSMLEVLRQDYIRTARSKGASQTSVNYDPCAAQRAAAGGHHHRHRGGVPGRRPDRHRDGVQHSRRRALPRRGHPVARLSDRAEPGDADRLRAWSSSISWSTWPTWPSTLASSTRTEGAHGVIDHDAALARAGANVTGLLEPGRLPDPALSAGRGRRGHRADLRPDGASSPTVIAPHDPTSTNARASLAAPGGTYWLGADFMGRDMFSRIVYGARISLAVGVGATLLGGILGVLDRPDVGLSRRLVRSRRPSA